MKSRWPRTKLHLELLEDRTVPAFSVTSHHGLLTLTSTTAADSVTIHDQGNGSFGIEQNGNTTTYDGISGIKVSAKGDGSTVEMVTDSPNGVFNDGLSFSLDVSFRSGTNIFLGQLGDPTAVPSAGHANIKMRISGGSGPDSLNLIVNNAIPAGMNVAVGMNGGQGNDNVSAVFEPSPYINGNLDVRLLGGDGNDDVSGSISNTGVDVVNNGNVRFDVEGGDGNDSVAFRAADLNTASFTNNGTIKTEVEGGDGNDIVNNLIGNDGVPVINNGTIKIEAEGNDGNNTVAVAMGINPMDGSPFTFLNRGTASMWAEGEEGTNTINATAAIEGGSASAKFSGKVESEGHDTVTFFFDREGPGTATAKLRANRHVTSITVTPAVQVHDAPGGVITVV
jgi:hypothetical protein